MMSLTFGLFTQVSGSGPLGPLVLNIKIHVIKLCNSKSNMSESSCQSKIWILCQNSLIRELKIRVVGFVLKKIFIYFEMLIASYVLYCLDGCCFVFYLF